MTDNIQGEGDMSIFEYSYSKIIFEYFGVIIYYQDVPKFPVPLNTQHTIHSNAKSHNFL